MRHGLIFSVIATLLLSTGTSFADPPVISHNVHVFKNATQAQCTSSWRGRASPDAMGDVSRFGQGTVESPGLKSCVGCQVDSASQDCVCRSCYEFFNN